MVGQRQERAISLPRARSRAGDFAFAGIAGLVAIISTLMATDLGIWGALGAVVMFFGALAVRFFSLSDAPVVSAGTNVSQEQLNTLKRLRAVLNALPQPVMLLDGEGRVGLFNPACAELFGAGVGGRHISSVVRAPQALDVLTTAQRTNKPYEAEFAFPGERERVCLFYAAPLGALSSDDEGSAIVMLRDRTEQKKLERMRTDFIANASHELRTPLTSMAGFIETLQGHARNDAAARDRFLSIMDGQVERMQQLVEDLIGLSAIELNETRVPQEAVDLRTVVRSVAEALGPLAQRNGAHLAVTVPEHVASVTGDRHELYRLFQNLCDNALKYGVPAGASDATIDIAVGRGVPTALPGAMRTGDSPMQIAARAGTAIEKLYHVQVIDRGEGIERDDLPRLTERFYRVNPQLSRAKGGTGLGLAIVKHILQRHKAGLQIESVTGEGSVFTVFFPPRDDADLPKVHGPDSQRRTEDA